MSAQFETLRRAAFAIAIAAALCALPAAAQTPAKGADAAKPETEAAQVKKLLEQRFPGATVSDVSKSPYFGLYEAQFDGQMVYTDAKVAYVIVGSVYDAASKQNLSEERQRRLNRIAFDALPLDLAIKRVKGNGTRKLVVFSDADCPFCARLENELKSVDDVTVYTFLYPIDQLHPDAARQVADHLVRARPVEGLGRSLQRRQAPGQRRRLRNPARQAAGARPEDEGQRDAHAGVRRRLGDTRRAAARAARNRVEYRRGRGQENRCRSEEVTAAAARQTAANAPVEQQEPEAPPKASV